MPSTERWYTVTELAELTGRKQNSIRRHLVEEWSLDGKARKVNGRWEVNQAAFDDLANRIQRCEREKSGEASEQPSAFSAIGVPQETPEERGFDSLQILAASNLHVVEKIIQRVIDGGQKTPDALALTVRLEVHF